MRFLFVRIGEWLPRHSWLLVQTLIYGAVAGLAAVAFHHASEWLYANGIVRFSHWPAWEFLLASFLMIVSTSLIAGILLDKFSPSAAGSGIPQVKLAFWKEFGVIPFRTVWVKFVASTLTLGGGSSLGREGPSIQIAAGLASNVAGWLGIAKQKRRLATVAGAAAGLAAAFNTPLAAVVFVLEEIVANLNSKLLSRLLLASIIGAFVAHEFIGNRPAFDLPSDLHPSYLAFAITPFAAAFAAWIGALFQTWALDLRQWNNQLKTIPRWLRPTLGGLVAWVLGCIVFLWTGHLGVFSLGYDDLTTALTQVIGWKLALILLVAKLVATSACYGLGGCGGIFSPTLFFGGMSGVFIASLASLVLPISHDDQLTVALCAMCASLGSVVRAPMTAMLIVFEMTHEFALLPAIMLGVLVSEAVGRWFHPHNFYDALLEQDGWQEHQIVPPRDIASWGQLPVTALANRRPVWLEDLEPETIRATLEKHPFSRFPLRNASPAAVLTRPEAEAALLAGRAPHLEVIPVVTTTHTIRQVQSALIESTQQVILVTEREGAEPSGLVTLHDLLRSHQAYKHEVD